MNKPQCNLHNLWSKGLNDNDYDMICKNLVSDRDTLSLTTTHFTSCIHLMNSTQHRVKHWMESLTPYTHKCRTHINQSNMML